MYIINKRRNTLKYKMKFIFSRIRFRDICENIAEFFTVVLIFVIIFLLPHFFH